MTIRWPETVLRPQTVAFDIAPRSIAGGASVAGNTQVVSSGAGIWVTQFNNVVVNNRQSVIAWRAVQTLLEGRVGTILVPRCSDYQPIYGDSNDLGLVSAVPHSDGTYFSDDAGYIGSGSSVTASAGAAVGATSMSFAIAYAGTIQPGQDFSIGERMYRLKTVTYTSASAASVTFSPPLRDAVVSGDIVEFDDPVCRMRLASDNEMDLILDGRKFSAPSVRFVEDV